MLYRNQKKIPWISEKLLYLILPKSLRDPLMGDLHEEFLAKSEYSNRIGKTRWWYRSQVLKSFRYFILKNRGDIMLFILSIIVFIGMAVGASFLGTSGRTLLNVPSFIAVLIPSFMFAIAATSVQSWRLCLKLLFLNNDCPKKKDIEKTTSFLKVFGNMSIALGLFFTLLGAMQILSGFDSSLSESEYSIFKASSVCLLALFYGIGFKSILYVADQRLQNKFLS